MFFCKLKKNEQYICRQGDEASCFFIIADGECIVEIDGKARRTLTSGDGFGELALLYNAPRSASIKADTPMFHCWGIERKQFRSIIEENAKKHWEDNKKSLEKVPLFSNLALIRPSDRRAEGKDHNGSIEPAIHDWSKHR